jgi:hypothetical protein
MSPVAYCSLYSAGGELSSTRFESWFTATLMSEGLDIFTIAYRVYLPHGRDVGLLDMHID